MVRNADVQTAPFSKQMTEKVETSPPADDTFPGFEPLEANFVFCPNQFFDLVIPNYSRPVVRLVSYILHETLRWLDENGQPVRQDIAISFNDLVEKAGIARGSIRQAIGEALKAKLIQCVVKGRSKTTGEPGRVGEYSLMWDETGHYAKSVETFAGFYLGQGNRSPIPHAFFSHVVPMEPLAVIKVVGTVLRYTVGYQNQYGGGRRTEARLSFRTIHRYARIGSPATLAESIRQAVANGYVHRVSKGRFSSRSDEQTATVYSVNWLRLPQKAEIGSVSVAGDRFKIRSSRTVQKPKQDRFEKRSSKGSEFEAEDRFKNRTIVNNNVNNQQTTVAAASSIALLRKAGFTELTALALAGRFPEGQIANQVLWLRYRTAKTNRLGLLRKAIEENWPEPTGSVVKRRSDEFWKKEAEADRGVQLQERDRDQDHKAWVARWLEAPEEVRRRCKDMAIHRESNPIVRKHLQNFSIDRPPHPNIMIEFKGSAMAN
jgi:hypothetical protein